MKRVVITNSPKVEDKFRGKAEIRMLKDASAHQVFEEGRNVVENGGRLIIDPTAGNMKSYYKSLAFVVKEDSGLDEKSMEKIQKGLDGTRGMEKGKEPVLSGIMQNGEINTLKRVLG